jgi:hypothetical protein
VGLQIVRLDIREKFRRRVDRQVIKFLQWSKHLCLNCKTVYGEYDISLPSVLVLYLLITRLTRYGFAEGNNKEMN